MRTATYTLNVQDVRVAHLDEVLEAARTVARAAYQEANDKSSLKLVVVFDLDDGLDLWDLRDQVEELRDALAIFDIHVPSEKPELVES